MCLGEGSPSLLKTMSVLPHFATEAALALITSSLTALLVRTADTAPETWSTKQRYGAVFSPAVLLPRNPKSKRYHVVLPSPGHAQSEVASADLPLLVMPHKVSTMSETECVSLSATHSQTHLVLQTLSSLGHLDLLCYLYPVCPRSSPQFHRDDVAPAVHARKTCQQSKLNIDSPCSVSSATLSTGHTTSVTTNFTRTCSSRFIEASAQHQGGHVVTAAPPINDCKDPELVTRPVLSSCRDQCHKHDVVGMTF